MGDRPLASEEEEGIEGGISTIEGSSRLSRQVFYGAFSRRFVSNDVPYPDKRTRLAPCYLWLRERNHLTLP
jgi:hypothetical protein